MIDELTKNKELSSYQPPQDVVDFTAKMKKDYSIGMELITKPWTELNFRSVVDDQNRGQLMFNAFVDESIEDPNEAWRWRGTRSMARNKALAMHANLTAAYLLPLFLAQNDNDETDRDMSEVMQECVEWLAQPTNSDYQKSFLQVVFGMITDPIIYLGADFCKVMQKLANGEEIEDEVLSGFQSPVWGATQILLANAFERNIQKQRFIIQRRYVEKEELEAKYGDNPRWQFVRSGIKSIYSEDDGLFYDVKDDDHQNLVAEEIWKSRRQDKEIPMINGICMASDVNNSPIKHRDNRNAPKYNVTPFGYYHVGNHFVYYKSMMNALGWDNMLIDAMYEVGMNNELLQQDMPMAFTGTDKIDSEVVFPRAVITLDDKDARAMPLLPPRNTGSAWAAMQQIEDSMSDQSVNETMSGQLPDASQKAYTVAQATANAKKLLAGVGKSLAASVVQYGDLMKDIVVNHITIPQVEELVSGAMKLKYKNLILDKNGTERTIKFDEGLIGKSMSKQDKEYRELSELDKMVKKTGKGYEQLKDTLRIVNPEIFAKFKYLTKVDLEQMFNKNQEYWQPILISLRQVLANDPYIDMKGLDKKLIYSYFQSDGDELIKDAPDEAINQMLPNSNVGQQVLNKQTAQAVSNPVI